MSWSGCWSRTTTSAGNPPGTSFFSTTTRRPTASPRTWPEFFSRKSEKPKLPVETVVLPASVSFRLVFYVLSETFDDGRTDHCRSDECRIDGSNETLVHGPSVEEKLLG